MERSSNTKLEAYEYLAYYYDLLLSDTDSFSLWLKEIESEEFKDVLELASGSGLMAKILKEKGYNIIASDISSSMKEAASKNFDGEYLILNMSNYKLYKKFDLILCICDSINYLNEDELDSFFKCCYDHLNKNGRLIFDMHHLNRLNEFENEYIEENTVDGLEYQWTIVSDKDSSTLNEHFTFYTPNGMIQEQHLQNVFKPSLIIKKMKDLGYDVKYIEDFVKDEKVLLVGRK